MSKDEVAPADLDFPVVGNPAVVSATVRAYWTGRAWKPQDFVGLVRPMERLAPLSDFFPLTEVMSPDLYRRHEAWRRTIWGGKRVTYYFAPAHMSEEDAYVLAKKRKIA